MDARWIRSQELELPYPSHSFSNQTIIVTGANVGLGLEAARHFVRLDASRVILAVRSLPKGEAAKADIEASVPNSTGVVEVWELDLAKYESVKSFAQKVDAEVDRVDVVCANAGVAMMGFVMAEDCETTITVNVISTILLAILLLPKLRQSADEHKILPRLSIVTSGTHARAKFLEGKEEDVFKALADGSKVDMVDRYSTSKLVELLAAREMIHHVRPDPKIVINFVSPGFCKSELTRNATGDLAAHYADLAKKYGRTTEAGSRTLVHGAVIGVESHGKYLADCEVQEDSVSEFVRSPEGKEMQKKIWTQLMEKLETIQPDIRSYL